MAPFQDQADENGDARSAEMVQGWRGGALQELEGASDFDSVASNGRGERRRRRVEGGDRNP